MPPKGKKSASSSKPGSKKCFGSPVKKQEQLKDKSVDSEKRRKERIKEAEKAQKKLITSEELIFC